MVVVEVVILVLVGGSAIEDVQVVEAAVGGCNDAKNSLLICVCCSAPRTDCEELSKQDGSVSEGASGRWVGADGEYTGRWPKIFEYSISR